GRSPPLMVGRKLIGRLAAAGAVAGFAFVAVVALGATLYALLSMVLVPAGAAALTALIAAAAAGLCAWIAAGKALGASEPEEPVGLGQRAVELFRQRPILGAAAALAGGWIFLRNPALATMVAAAFTETSHPRRRR